MRLVQTLHHALRTTPDRPLTVCGDRVRTVRETVDRVSRLAAGLRDLGTGPGDRVAILALNSDRYHETFFAAWWCGAVINPVNVRWSPVEIIHALRDARPTALLVDDAFLPVVPEIERACPELTALIYCGEGATPTGMVEYDELLTRSAPIPDARRGDDDLAALFYTGGTTGHPKGVMVSHRGLLTSALVGQVAEPTCVAGGAILIAAPMFHMAAVQGWVTQHLVGGTFVYLPGFEATAVLEAIDRHRITRLTLVPTMLQLVVDHPGLTSYDVSSVHTLGYGASPISTALLERVRQAFPSAGLAQGYGMTETGLVTVLGSEDHRAGGARLRSAGRPVPQCDVRIVDADGVELGPGEVGEVVVRGDQVMLGYWDLPDETAAAVVDGWMHTGDAGRLDDGYLYLVDRIKDMIISGGENVYSAEVENALASHAAVESVAVVGVPDEHWGELVHAAVVVKPRQQVTASELVAHARTRIAGYKVPRSVEFVERLPVSATGKVLKRELRTQRAGAC